MSSNWKEPDDKFFDEIGALDPTRDLDVINKRLKDLRNRKTINLIGPGVRSLVKLEAIPACYGISWHCFLLDPTVGDPDANPPIPPGPHVYREKNWTAGTVALKREALLEMWNSVDGKVILPERLDDGHDPHYCRYRWTGSAMSLSGQALVKSADVETDLRDGSERAKSLKGGLSKARMYISRSTESKAQNAVIREMLGIIPNYTLETVSWPFVLMKLVFMPPMEDKLTRFLVIANGIGAMNSLFGGPTGPELMQKLLQSVDTPEPGVPELPAPAQPVKELEPPKGPTPSEPETDPFAVEAPKQQPIRSVADYEALETQTNGNAATPALIAALTELTERLQREVAAKGGKVAATVPVDKWTKAQRQRFIARLVENGLIAK